ncbi:MAG: RNA pyrophosphohydrolase [Gammaproteobacteria bacterium]|nr:RNA pyrophosphohydrolase [Gammaproteobacteria bacterium]
MIDRDGYRFNVGIILSNDDKSVFWAKRYRQNAWQFPQGGIAPSESPEEAMYRELYEEVGLRTKDVEIIGRTSRWLRYDLPKRFIRRNNRPICKGQKQIWFMLRMVADDAKVNLNKHNKPEFDEWRWVDYWQPVNDVVYFKQDVYSAALNELAPMVFEHHQIPPKPKQQRR